MTVDALSEVIRSRYKHTSSFFSGLALVFFDGLMVMLCFGASFFLINIIDYTVINFKSFVNYWVYLPAFLAVFYAVRLYPGIMLAPADEVRGLTLSCASCFTGIALSIAVETDSRSAISIALLLSIPIASIMLPTGREIARTCFSHFAWWGVPAIVYCKNNEGLFIIDRLLNHIEFGYRPVLILNTGSENLEVYKEIPITAPSEQIHAMIQKLKIKTAIIVESGGSDSGDISLEDTILMLYRYTILIPRSTLVTVAFTLRDFGGIIGFASTHNLTKPGNLFMKRFLDLFLILVSAPLAVPLTLCIALVIKATSPGTAFYGHPRAGKYGSPFKTWKFRTMVVDADQQLQKLLESSPKARREWDENRKLENDPRVTPLGKFLRKTSLDEVPQFWNILTGKMSFVGPRPVTQSELDKYGDKATYLLSVKPGLSGMWQISGRSDTGYEERVKLDSYYIQNWSIWLDIWIIIKTVGVVLNHKGAY